MFKFRKSFLLLLVSSAILSPQVPADARPACGNASWYEHGTKTASGESYNPDGDTAAHPWLPFGTTLVVTNQDNGASITVRVNDRGPFVGGRIIDLSRGAFRKIALLDDGVVRVCIR